jgi:hypothetical protein
VRVLFSEEIRIRCNLNFITVLVFHFSNTVAIIGGVCGILALLAVLAFVAYKYRKLYLSTRFVLVINELKKQGQLYLRTLTLSNILILCVSLFATETQV